MGIRGFERCTKEQETEAIRSLGYISPTFMLLTCRKLQLVIDYKRVNQSLAAHNFRVDQISDLTPTLRSGEALSKADIVEAYYPLRLCARD